ncbi:hypothetical protein B0H14DRAFT_2599153 [Mycena olivaceomarginata]|nr:hypothetical protein B0H14DRAFT_2599153 [Mycena olivaceomarginata]
MTENASAGGIVAAELEAGAGAGTEVQLPNAGGCLPAPGLGRERERPTQTTEVSVDRQRLVRRFGAQETAETKRQGQASGGKSEERERRERKERKKAKKEKKEKKKSKSTTQWGNTVSSQSIFTKGQEFHAWLVEERKINPETYRRTKTRRSLRATLPDEKYYNMESYSRRMSALRQGEFVPPPDDSYDAQADMKAIIGAHKKQAVEHESYLSREQLMELRKVQHERIEAGKMKQLGMDVKQNMGGADGRDSFR